MIYGIYILRITDSGSDIKFQSEYQGNNQGNYISEIQGAINKLKQIKKTQKEKGYIDYTSQIKIYYKKDDDYVFSVISDKTFSKENDLVKEVQNKFKNEKKSINNEYLEEIRNNYSNKIKNDKGISSNNEESLKEERTHQRKNNSENSEDKNDKDNSSSQKNNSRVDSSQGSLSFTNFLKTNWLSIVIIFLIFAFIGMIITNFLGLRDMATNMVRFIFNKK